MLQFHNLSTTFQGSKQELVQKFSLRKRSQILMPHLAKNFKVIFSQYAEILKLSKEKYESNTGCRLLSCNEVRFILNVNENFILHKS